MKKSPTVLSKSVPVPPPSPLQRRKSTSSFRSATSVTPKGSPDSFSSARSPSPRKVGGKKKK